MIMNFHLVSAEVFENNPVLDISFFDIPKTFDNVYSKLDSFNVNLNEDGNLEYTIKFHFISPTPFDLSENYYEDFVTKLTDGQYAGGFTRENIIGTPNFVFFLDKKNYDILDIQVLERDKLIDSVNFRKSIVCVSSEEPCNYLGRQTPQRMFSGEGYIVMWKLNLNKEYNVKIIINTKTKFKDGENYDLNSLILLPYKHVDFNKIYINLPSTFNNKNTSLDIIPYSTSGDYDKFENPIKTYLLIGKNNLILSENYDRNINDYSILRVNMTFKTESWFVKKIKEYKTQLIIIVIMLVLLIGYSVYSRRSISEIVKGVFKKRLKDEGIPLPKK